MSGMIDCRFLNRMYSPLNGNRTVRRTAAQSSTFLDMVAKTSKGTTDVLEISNRSEVTTESETSNVDTYKKYLENKYEQVMIQHVGKDQASLQKADSRMNDSSVVVAPNILEDMANAPQKAAYYEQKIDDFFNATPRLTA
ncbi:hypothetical protein I5Q82_00560 [Acutalibacter muris]|uniref:Uncharacterized protein n=1 Tax=Acutalibacter muris TaxID=1796620 RepID=A0A1Z2XRE1_9FIRM|nr:hypothetical protein A4V00_18050 [Hungateiclostridiaceae bacterium KB18]ASB40996.1 hypothetical protein ADH66_10240 [Acutalibacter muris]QQR30277.1 hypothetical protein I5Q82_00560 [Acutalibacter muris]